MASPCDATPEQDLKRKMKSEFKTKIIPSLVICHLDINSLSEEEESRIEATEKQHGAHSAASELLDILFRKDDWFNKLIKVLRKKEVRLSHVADVFEKIKAQVDSDWKSSFAPSRASPLTQTNGSTVNTFQFGNPPQQTRNSNYERDAGRQKHVQIPLRKSRKTKDTPDDDVYDDVVSMPDKAELRRKILSFLKHNETAQRTLVIAKACGCTVTKDVNPTLHELKKEGLITKCSDSPPMWQMTTETYEPFEYPVPEDAQRYTPFNPRPGTDLISSATISSSQQEDVDTLSNAFHDKVSVGVGDDRPHFEGAHGDNHLHYEGFHGDDRPHYEGVHRDDRPHYEGAHGDDQTHYEGAHGDDQMHYEGAHGDDRTHFEGAHGDNHPQKAQHYDVPKAAAKDRHHCEGAVAAALEPRCEGAAAVAQEPRCCKGSVGGQHQEVILNNQREAAVSRRSSRTSSKTLTSSPSKKGRDFTKEEVTGALQHMAGWKSVNTDIEVSHILKDYLTEDGSYVLWFWEQRARPAITVIYQKEIVTFVIHKKTEKTKTIFYIAEDQKIEESLKEVVVFHAGQNGVRDTRKDRKTYGQTIPLCKPL